jgi:hypothetical protein
VAAGGRTLSVGFDSITPGRAFAAAESGGLFQTADNGVHWTHVDTLVPFRMSDVKISPSQPNTIIATVRNDSRASTLTGIWRSTDGGVTWQRPPTGVPPKCAQGAGRAIAFSPDSNHVYVGTDCSIAVSSDLGATWTHVVPSAGSGAVLAVTAQPGGLVDIMALDGFHRSLDHGATWSGTGTGMGGGIDQHTIAASPIENGVLVAVGGSSTQRWDVFESDDGGTTWQSLGAPVNTNGRPPFISAHLAADNDPTHFDVYYHDSVSVFRQTCTSGVSGLRCSSTWIPVGIQHTDCDELGYSAGSNCPALLVGDGGIQTSSDCGVSFQFTGGGVNGYNALQMFAVIDQVHPDHTDIYYTTQDNGDAASGDNGFNWPGAIGGDGCGLDMLHSTATNVGQTIAGATCFGSIFKDTALFGTGGSVNWNSPTANSSTNPFILADQVWVQFAQTPPSSANDLYITTDTGGTWTKVNGGTINNGFIGGAVNVDERLRVSGPSASPTVYAPFRRTDGTVGLNRITGVRTGSATITAADVTLGSIAQYTPGEEGQSNPAVWNVDPNTPSRLMAVDIVAKTIKTTSNSGATWTTDALLTSLVQGSGQFLFAHPSFGSETHAIAFDPADGRRILVGTDSGGLFASFDNGVTWGGIPGSNVITGITDISFDEVRSDVYVSTYGRGLWKVAWCPNPPPPTDTVPPVFTFVPPDITTSNCGTITLGTPRAVDVCQSSAVTFTNNAPAKFTPGTTIVTWTARDAAGNTTTATQRVTLLLGDDPACCPAGTNIIVGTSNNDTLNGTAGSDCIIGKGGQDTINGLGGNDFISGGDGDDVISGGPGNDVIFGGSGQDTINGDADNDVIFGQDGDDTIHGGTGNDVIHGGGGTGQDHLFGDDGDDQLFGEAGFDDLQGGNGNDAMIGGAATNTCEDTVGTNTFAQCQPPAPNSCADGIKDGVETDVDCGKFCDVQCAVGKTCISGNDCASGLCGAGTCKASDGIGNSVAGLLQASLQITTDWGAGYCASLFVINNALQSTTNWSVVLNINQATTFTTWNGNFSGPGGIVTVSPTLAGSKTLAPDAVDGQTGFCANRNVPNSGALPSVVSATGVFF